MVPSIAASITSTKTQITAFPKEESSIPANLAPNHKNMASTTIRAINPTIPAIPNAPIVNGSIIFTPKLENEIQYLNFILFDSKIIKNII